LKPKVVHNEAMEFSFKAKKAFEEGKNMDALEYYYKAAELESQVAEFYFDKPDLEPTRSVVIRSAAFLNLKAGRIEIAKKFIFFGLLHCSDEIIKSQLNNALELAVSLKYKSSENASKELTYLTVLRQRSVHYSLEPSIPEFGDSVSLEMIKEFAESYLKSLKAFALSKYRRLGDYTKDTEEYVKNEISKIINPVVTNSAYGSFKFSVANDYLARSNESKEILNLKANIVSSYHREIFVNPLEDEDIEEIKEEYSESEVNEIFKPLTKIKSNKAPYKIGYYDNENFNKMYSARIVNRQRRKLITIQRATQEDIGQLESLIVHKRSSEFGKTKSKTLIKKELKSYEFDIDTNEISSSDNGSIILSEYIVINVHFDSENGFKFYFDDLDIEYFDVEFERGLKDFNNMFYHKIIELGRKEFKSEAEEINWSYIKTLIGNVDKLINQ